MRSLTIALFVCLTAQGASAASRYVLDDATRGKVEALMGQEFVADLDAVYAEGRKFQALPYAQQHNGTAYDPGAAASCLENLVAGKSAQKKGDEKKAATAFHNCAYSCKNESQRHNSPFREIAKKYAPACTGQKLADEAVGHLARFDKGVAEAKEAKGALNALHAVAVLRGALKQARDGLGDSDQRITSRQAILTGIEQQRGAELKRASAFLARPDVVELQKKMDYQRARVADLERLGYAKNQLELAKNDLRESELKYGSLVRKAGL